MEREYVESTMITSIGYDDSCGTVEVEYRSNMQIWQYYDVPESVYYNVRRSASIGTSFNTYIKSHFREARVG